MVLKDARQIAEVFRKLAKYADLGPLSFSNKSTPATLILNSKWSQRDLELGEKTSFTKTYFFSESDSNLKLLAATTPQHHDSTIQWNKESPSGKLRAVVVKTKTKKGEEKQYFEIWNDAFKLKTFDFQNCEKHGKVYEEDSSGQFGCLEWSPSEKYLVYVAERKRPKAESFFKNEKDSVDDGKKEDVIKGDEHVYRENWGEQMGDKHAPVACILDVETGDITVLDCLPAHLSAGQALWAANDEGVVFCAWDHEPYRLGITYCRQRRGGVYFVDIKNTSCTLLSEEDRAVFSPRFNPDKSRLVYLDSPPRGAHSQCLRLVMYEWETKKRTVIVDIVHSATGSDFPGIFANELPGRCWLNDGKELILTSCWRSQNVCLVVNTNTRSVKKLDVGNHSGSYFASDVKDNYVLLKLLAPDKRSHFAIGKYDPSGTRWLPVGESDAFVGGYSWEVIKHEPTQERIHSKYPELDYESILFLPTAGQSQTDRKPPLIVFPHGGPHTNFDIQYHLFSAGFCLCGYAVLMVNYRGSTGFGQNSIESLMGTVGDQDVKDVWGAAMSVIESGQVDNKMAVFGGSHGGFLTTHLIGQYPGKFKAASTRNPVTDLTSMLGLTDITDWIFAETGQEFTFASPKSPELLLELWKRSPLSYIDQVNTPIQLMIGNDDRRVPPAQAKEYYRALKARNQTVRFLAYEDNAHPIITVPAESDSFVNTVVWFSKYIDS